MLGKGGRVFDLSMCREEIARSDVGIKNRRRMCNFVGILRESDY